MSDTSAQSPSVWNTEDSLHLPSDSQTKDNYDLLYQVQDNPPWYLCILFGFQHYLMTLSGVALPIIVTSRMCIGNDDVGQSEVVATSLFVEGIVTCLQSTLGTRLPIVQGASIAFLIPTLAILDLPKWECPTEPVGINGTELFDWRREVWTTRMREIQGAVAVVGVVQVVIGLSGVVGLLLRYIGPVCIAVVLTLLGLSPLKTAAKYSARHWGIAFMVLALMTIFSQYLRNVKLPGYRRGKGCVKSSISIFKLIPVITAVVVTWLFCLVLTVTNVLPADPGQGYGYYARTDIKLDALAQANWFRFPYPGQWGWPTVSIAAVLGIFAGSIGGMMESVGDYSACAELTRSTPIPSHAVNRGLMIEGLGVLISGLWGSGVGLTSYSGNIGAIGITKIASRRVIQCCGVILIIFGLLGKVGAVFVAIPEPILGGIFLSLFGLITAVGVSTLRHADMTSSRNLYIYGSSVFLGLAVSTWMAANPGAIKTGSDIADQVLTVVLSVAMLIGGVFAFILDNTISGTRRERGLLRLSRSRVPADDTQSESTVYHLPFVMKWIKRWTWTRFVPVCPTFTGFRLAYRKPTYSKAHVKTTTVQPPQYNSSPL